jgi:hypothetical protein
MSKSKTAAAAAEPATDETPTDASAGDLFAAGFKPEQIQAIDARIAAALDRAQAGIGAALAAELTHKAEELRTRHLAELDAKGAELLAAAADMSVPGTVELKAGDPARDYVPTVHELARAFAKAGVDLDPEQIMTDPDGSPAWALRDGVMSVITVDGRKVEVSL